MIVPAELDTLVYWMTERDRIRAAKEAGKPKPWTEDPHLRDNRWCNVRRMDDLVSRELFSHWYPREATPETCLLAAVLARLVNWTPALMEILDADGRGRFSLSTLPTARATLRRRFNRGDKVFTGAYVVPGVPGKAKVDSVMDLVMAVAARQSLIVKDSMRGTWTELMKFDGMGSFLAGQVVADLAHLGAGVEWSDAGTWAPVGPGSARGINRLQGKPKDKAVSQTAFQWDLANLMEELKPRVEVLWTDRCLQAFDIQNCLCEFDKYRRLQLGEGKTRSRYDGRAAPGQGSMFS